MAECAGMMRRILNFLFPQTYRTLAELPKEKFLLHRSINNFDRTTLREWRTR
jgi:hypothetical protein